MSHFDLFTYHIVIIELLSVLWSPLIRCGIHIGLLTNDKGEYLFFLHQLCWTNVISPPDLSEALPDRTGSPPHLPEPEKSESETSLFPAFGYCALPG